MPSGTHAAEVQDAIEAVLTERLAPLAPKVTVRGLTGGDFDEETARLVVNPPAALVVFTGETFDRRREHLALTYQSAQTWDVVVGARNLRSTEEERAGALELLSEVSNALAGARLTLASSAQPALVVVQSVRLAQFDDEGTWYALRIEVESVAQFAGQAA